MLLLLIADGKNIRGCYAVQWHNVTVKSRENLLAGLDAEITDTHARARTHTHTHTEL
jgi:hypothetical protein